MSNRIRPERPSEAAMRITEGGTVAKVSVMLTPDLIAAAKVAKRTGRNRQLSPELIRALDPDGTHVVNFSMIHNDMEVRIHLLCKVVGSMKPVGAWLDIPFKTFFNKVTDVPVPDVSQEDDDDV